MSKNPFFIIPKLGSKIVIIQELPKHKRKILFSLIILTINKSVDFEELWVALENDLESFSFQQFSHLFYKKNEENPNISLKENLRIQLKNQMFSDKLSKGKYSAFKIKFKTHYSFEYTIGYLETYFEPEEQSTIIVSKFYLYKLYNSKGYIKRTIQSVFKELFLRYYHANNLKIQVFDNDATMKRFLQTYGFKYIKTEPWENQESASLIYKITRKDIRKIKKGDDSFISDILKNIKKAHHYNIPSLQKTIKNSKDFSLK